MAQIGPKKSFTALAASGIHTLTEVQKNTQSGTYPGKAFEINYLLVAGGGGGGGANYQGNGGGGAGGLLEDTLEVEKGTEITITVGGGGAGGLNGTDKGVAFRGSDSTIAFGGTTLRAYGGGAGAGYDNNTGREDGGSGAGNGAQTGVGFTIISYKGEGVYLGSGYVDAPRQGYDGGLGGTQRGGGDNPFGGGGGAGAAPAGVSGNQRDGGIGYTSSITGTAIAYAGGGGGGQRDGDNDPGDGADGGGNGGRNAAGSDATVNTGGGGGGGGGSTSTDGGDGGSGIVILRSPIQAAFTSGSPVETTDAGDYIYKFTGSGTITF